MAKKIYVGVSNVARKVKGSYFGVNDVARKVKKAYIGVGGVARPFWPGGLSYYGTAPTGLSAGRAWLAGKGFGSYAVFAGGTQMTSTGVKGSPLTTVEAFNSALTRTLPTTLSNAGTNFGNSAAKVGSYLLIGKPSNGSIDSYNTSLTRYAIVSHDRDVSLGAENASYAFFAGSVNYPAWVNAFNSSLTKQTKPTNFNVSYRDETGHARGGAGSVGSYAVFAGGVAEYSGDEEDYTEIHSDVHAINGSLTVSNCTALTEAKAWAAAATIGSNVMFGGGMSGDDQAFCYGSGISYKSSVDSYNSSLTKSTRTALSAGGICAAAVLDGNAIYVNGNSANTDIYNASFTKTVGISIGAAYKGMAAAVVGNKALFAGGHSGSTNNANVYVYTV